MPRDERSEKRSSRDRSRDRSRRSSRRRSESPDRKKHRRHKDKRSSTKSSKRSRDSSGSSSSSASASQPLESTLNDDSGLSKKFVWKKKVEQDKARGLSREERERASRERRQEAERELENLRKRREQREIEKQQREEEMKRVRREQEQEKLGDWERREEEFHLGQAKKRAEIRIRDHRPKPVDVMAMNLRLANEALGDEEIAEIAAGRLESDEPPDQMVRALSAGDCEELLHDVEMYLSLETNAHNVEFWENLLVVCSAHLRQMSDGTRPAGSAVGGDVRGIIGGKSLSELLDLETDVQAKLGGKDGAVDVDYWEQVRAELAVEKARVTLAEMHRDIVERRGERLRQARLRAGNRGATGSHGAAESAGYARNSDVERRKREKFAELQRRILSGAGQPSGSGSGSTAADIASSADDRISRELYEAELRRGHDPSEAIFSVEAALSSKSYAWQDKHRPRKPRYFNRVHTGYEWNKYNRTHYDKDNPPPKVVQGYKFNIFYPDLIDKSVAPTYRVEGDPADEDTVVLRFMAGPPYEDIAFRIVKREWEYNRRMGFRNTFDRGVLQLHFRFKRHFYRR
ncbi:hypothetical protein GGI15_001354 [Coemansia interrupta]|uniref:Splicing factor Cactin n=1 Tax=Coemansia interrupta TaxID=1126814 RepID=A0A9W8HIL1_9FUNG|nr:hypothetical protein GGI15_001354 [Coemansia interrupta]